MGKEKFDKKEWMEKSMQMKGQMHDMIFQIDIVLHHRQQPKCFFFQKVTEYTVTFCFYLKRP